MQYGRSGLVGGSIPPWSNVVQYISWIWCIRGYRPNFGTLTPSPIFPKICHYFGTFTPSRIFPKIYHNFGTSRIQFLGFVLRFRYFEFTAYDCRSLEFTRGPTNISSLLVVGTSVFLVPLTLHWKKAADIGSPRWRNEVTQPNQSHIFIWLHI